eukprot:TRINITY_DN7453_c0_g1_i9.p1 TRINITY_DN7453_c0_g1~~TRINITY_DN7453_c0_g1_i9.p1  ORF type:complete len:216 (+),score=61.63 TRINITY_DN7453_c0_g1_i9:176-823(+)
MAETRREKLNISFGALNDKNVEQLRILNQVCLPVQYSEKFYRMVLQYTATSRFAFFNDIVVGAITTRVEQRNNETTLYILTFTVLKPYRKFGVGGTLLDEAMKIIEKDKSITSIYLHVQTSNDVAVAFYQKRGFEIVQELKGYYKDISPPDCYLLRRKLTNDAPPFVPPPADEEKQGTHCLLYTSDAADDLLCVDLGGRRIIKKKKKETRSVGGM